MEGSLFFVHHILGIKATYASDYVFAVEPAQISTQNGQFSVQSNTNTTFTIQTIYFDSMTLNFAFGVKEIQLVAS